MKTFKDIRENVTDLSGHSHRSLSTILKDPTHPMHSAAKAERDRRMHKEANEEVELDELKKSTLGNYVKKASDDRAKNALEVGKTGKMNFKGLKRAQGINRAVNKLATEEVEQIDELTAAEKKLIDKLYDNKGKLTPLGKKVFATGQKND